MVREIRETVIDYMRKEGDVVTPSDIVKNVYPLLEKRYSKDTFKRLLFRTLGKDPKIIKNNNGPYYSLGKRRRFTKEEIDVLRSFFEMVHNRRINPDIPARYQYPQIPLERTTAFESAYDIISKLWEDPRDEQIFDCSEESDQE